MKKKIISLLLVIGLLFTGCKNTTSKSSEKVVLDNEKELAKNVIMIIPDGMSVDVLALARWYNGGKELNVDSLANGLVRTYSGNAAITDSAAASTALATGNKSENGRIGVLGEEYTMPGIEKVAEEDKSKPVASVLEGAKLQGKATGLVATCEIMHATPAGYSSHSLDRNDYNTIGEQQVYQNMDVVISGGSKFLSPEEREDKEDLKKIINEKDYNYVESKEELEKVKEGKVWAMLAETALPYDMDKNEDDISLAEMTSKAIELLSKDEDGFFLMVEASKIDWAAHANDPIGIISDALAYDEAVGVALDYAEENKETVVISVTDHANSGITLGNRTDERKNISEYMEPLSKAKLTGEGVENKLKENPEKIEETIAEYFGITDLSEEEIAEIEKAEEGTLNAIIGPMIAERSGIGFTSGNHTGGEVPLFIYTPEKVEKLSGTIENTDIPKYIAKVFGFDLKEVTDTLFVNAKEEFEKIGAKININTSDENNPVLEVTKDNTKIEFPENKNIAIKDGKTIELTGVTVYNGKDFYLSKDAIELVK
ncbi:alkaline phosphatase [Miniphocaeibacter halophilus]|uniref:Alkaline phosphatase n=1 Tax=Miniphocaeibacter halophilus TaxID=2931922 RepID=A0AC61MVG9_9FIRM|nr:alkaline phosphatase [Miniphocaeibacter halophilus]QQK08056.1 alkaline phosphatase [Miniphocaeibacter halophilus]